MVCLLVGHELDERSISGSKTGIDEVLVREASKTVVEEIQLDPFLV